MSLQLHCILIFRLNCNQVTFQHYDCSCHSPFSGRQSLEFLQIRDCHVQSHCSPSKADPGLQFIFTSSSAASICRAIGLCLAEPPSRGVRTCQRDIEDIYLAFVTHLIFTPSFIRLRNPPQTPIPALSFTMHCSQVVVGMAYVLLVLLHSSSISARPQERRAATTEELSTDLFSPSSVTSGVTQLPAETTISQAPETTGVSAGIN